MGEPKLLLPWRDVTVLEATLANVVASCVRHIIVVTGGYRPKIEALLQPPKAWLPAAGGPCIQSVHNPNHADGEMISSLKVGISSLANDSDGCLVMLGDMPLILPETINQVAEALQQHTLVAPMFEGQRGHPVGFGRKYYTPLLTLPPDGAPRDLIREHRHDLYLLHLNTQSILIDLDTRAAYERWRPA